MVPFFLVGILLSQFSYVNAEPQRAVFSYHWSADGGGSRYLKFEALSDALMHFEIYERRSDKYPDHRQLAPKQDAIWTSPMVDQNHYGDFVGAHSFQAIGKNSDATYRSVETPELKVEICPDLTCISIFDKKRNTLLSVLRTENLNQPIKTIHIEKLQMKNVYGVGNLFLKTTNPDGDWVGQHWNARGHGNFRMGLDLGDSFHSGGPSISQFPMIYALGPGLLGYGLFFDQVYKMSWNFRDVWYAGKVGWTASMWGDEIRAFVMAGQDFGELRTHYMKIVGRSVLPPKSVLGYWTSEFGYNDWKELREDVESLRKNDFPVDGAALDIQWFGGTFASPSSHRMGSLSFWEKDLFTPNSGKFENPGANIKSLFDDYALQLMPIEESYVDSQLDGDFRAMADPNFRRHNPDFQKPYEKYADCYLARINLHPNPGATPWEPLYVTTNYRERGDPFHQNWWGGGGMIDWTNPDARRYWHDLKRHWNAMKGIFSFWLDLGEPEMYYQDAFYHGIPEFGKHEHGSVHNIYNLSWATGISEGMERHGEEMRQALSMFQGKEYSYPPRHFTLSRAGTVGSHRVGGMWSGDVASNFENLNGHLQTQTNMSLLGVDLYSSDTGGFFHYGKEPKDTYDEAVVTRWASIASLLDLPMRTHAWADGEWVNEHGERVVNMRFALDVRGHLDSNRANVRRRYELIPYIYSLLHRAHLYGEPVYPPLVYYYQEDPNVRQIGHIKMIGKSILFRTVTDLETHQIGLYLPKGKWFDYENQRPYDGEKETSFIPLYRRERVPEAERKQDPQRAYFMNPLLAKAGSIIPKMYVDEKTMNVYGRRTDNSTRNELIVRVYSDNDPSEFTLYEDDGLTVGYKNGEVQTTRITQKSAGDRVAVSIEASEGDYQYAPKEREYFVELVADGRTAREVRLNGESCAEIPAVVDSKRLPEDTAQFEKSIRVLKQQQLPCWFHRGKNSLIRMATVVAASVRKMKKFEVELGE